MSSSSQSPAATGTLRIRFRCPSCNENFISASPAHGQRLNCPHCRSVFRCSIAKDENSAEPTPKAATEATRSRRSRPISAAPPKADTFRTAGVDFAAWQNAAKEYSRIATTWLLENHNWLSRTADQATEHSRIAATWLGKAMDHGKTLWSQSSQQSRYGIVAAAGLVLAICLGSLQSGGRPAAGTTKNLTDVPIENTNVRYGDERRMSDLARNEASSQAAGHKSHSTDLPPAIPPGINLKNQDAPPEVMYEIVKGIMSTNFLDQAYALKGVEAVSTGDQQRLVLAFEELLSGCNERYRLLLRADAIGDFRIDDDYESDLDTSSGRMRVIIQAEAIAYGLYLTQLPEAAEVLHDNVDNPVYGQMVYDYATAIEGNKAANPPERLQSLLRRIP